MCVFGAFVGKMKEKMKMKKQGRFGHIKIRKKFYRRFLYFILRTFSLLYRFIFLVGKNNQTERRVCPKVVPHPIKKDKDFIPHREDSH